MSQRLDEGDPQQIVHGLWNIPKPVDQFILHIHIFLLGLDGRDPLIHIQLLIFILNIRNRNIRIDIAVYHRLEILFLVPFSAQGFHRLI